MNDSDRALIFFCQRCGQVRIFGEWQELSADQRAYLEKNRAEWISVYLFCPSCEVTVKVKESDSLRKRITGFFF